jgi:hypothetical protein
MFYDIPELGLKKLSVVLRRRARGRVSGRRAASSRHAKLSAGFRNRVLIANLLHNPAHNPRRTGKHGASVALAMARHCLACAGSELRQLPCSR